MESQTHDSMGREKRHRLFLMLDEFPALGRLSFFETMMGAMAGYGLKVALVCQSLNHITRAYGRDNVIIDNCHIVSAYGAADIETAKRIADMAGDTWEMRESETDRRPRPIIGQRGGSSTWREERRPLMTPSDVRALARDEQLIFVAGAKPIRAKKLKFDEEGAFRTRLHPFSGVSEVLTVAHDWQSVRAFGTIAPSAQTLGKPPASSAKPATRGQDDLFEFVARPVSITDITPAQPPSAGAQSKESDAKPKSKGI
jgi:type IV secretion system protein VirD4